MTEALWRSMLRDVIQQVQKKKKKKQEITRWIFEVCLNHHLSCSMCGVGPAELGGEHHPPVSACQRHGGRSQPGRQF